MRHEISTEQELLALGRRPWYNLTCTSNGRLWVWVSALPIKVIVEPIGKATVTEVDENTATATFSGAGQVKLGDG